MLAHVVVGNTCSNDEMRLGYVLLLMIGMRCGWLAPLSAQEHTNCILYTKYTGREYALGYNA